MSLAETLRLLAENPIFAELSAESREKLVLAGIVREFSPRTLFLREGEPPENLFVLLKGSVRVFHTSPTGFEVVVKIFKAPCVFGEIELLVGIAFLENVSALEDCLVLQIPSATFTKILQSEHRVVLRLLHDVAARFCIATHNEKNLAFKDVRKRLAGFLVAYGSFDGERFADGVRIRLKITQDDMAAALGVTRRAVASEIIRWRKQGLLSVSAGRYLIHNMETLQSEAGASALSITYTMGKLLSSVGKGS